MLVIFFCSLVFIDFCLINSIAFVKRGESSQTIMVRKPWFRVRKEEKLDVDRKSRDKKSPILGEHVSQDIEKFSEEW